MAVNTSEFSLSAQQVWRMWSDGSTYASWVVGTSAIRDVDEDFPAPGSRIHYTVGSGPLRHEGHTEVLGLDEERRLVLEAHAWPLGAARIELEVTPLSDNRCSVTINERPSQGPGRVLHTPLSDAFLKLRNRLTLRRMHEAAARYR